MSLYEAFEPWLPTLLDLEHRKQDGDPDYQNVGFSALVFPVGATNLNSRRTELEERFFERYAMRKINQETLPRWQLRLQNRFDEIADRYERAYQIYADYAAQMNGDVLEGWQDTYSGSDSKEYKGNEALEYSGSEDLTRSGSEKVADKEKVTDTPDAAINDTQAFADTVESGESETTFNNRKDTRSFTNRKDTRSFTNREDKTTFGKKITRVITGNNILENVNFSIENWMDIDTLFVKEFENLFLNVFDY